MDRYWVFTFPIYYPLGGAEDLVGRYNDLELAKRACIRDLSEMLVDGMGHVYDSQMSTIVAKFRRDLAGSYKVVEVKEG